MVTQSATSAESRLKRSLWTTFLHYVPTLEVAVVSGGLALLTCVASVGIGCPSAVAAAIVVTTAAAYENSSRGYISQNLPSATASLHPGVCDSNCLLDRIVRDMNELGNGNWSISNANNISVLSSPNFMDASHDEGNINFKNKVIEVLSSGTTFIDITTLSNIEGEEYIEAISNSLLALENTSKTSGHDINVRIYLGLPGFFSGYPDYFYSILKRRMNFLGLPDLGLAEQNWDSHFSDLMGKLTSKLNGNGNLNLYISGGRSPIDTNWNHSKIISVDGNKSIVGGNNLWKEYFGNQPVFDTSLYVNGKASTTANVFANGLWNNHILHMGDNSHILKWSRGSITSNVRTVPAFTSGLEPRNINGTIKVVGIGQIGKSFGKSPLKVAINSMIRNAQDSIYISQQSLIHPYYNKPLSFLIDTIDQELMTNITSAVLRGVNVKVIISNENAPYDTTSNISIDDLYRSIWTSATQGQILNSAENRTKFCHNLKIGNLRVDANSETYPGTSNGFANHSKSIMVDNSTFLIGSHNMYEQSPAQLSEFSFLVSDANESNNYLTNYWNPLLEFSSRTYISDGDCERVVYPNFK